MERKSSASGIYLDASLFDEVFCDWSSVEPLTGSTAIGYGFYYYPNSSNLKIGFNPRVKAKDFEHCPFLSLIKHVNIGWIPNYLLLENEKSIVDFINDLKNLASLKTRYQFFGLNTKNLKQLTLVILHDYLIFPIDTKSLDFYKLDNLESLTIQWSCEYNHLDQHSFTNKTMVKFKRKKTTSYCENLNTYVNPSAILECLTPSRLPNLKKLILNNNIPKHKTNIDLGVLKKIASSLEEFHCFGRLTNNDLSNFPSFINCESLSICGGKVRVLPDLSQYDKLLRLNFSQNRIYCFDTSRIPESLKALNLSRNRISCLNDLNFLQNIEEIDLSNNIIKMLEDNLKDLKSIETISFDFNPLKKKSGLMSLPKLRDLRCLLLADHC